MKDIFYKLYEIKCPRNPLPREYWVNGLNGHT